jgi:hypothetical protein
MLDVTGIFFLCWIAMKRILFDEPEADVYNHIEIGREIRLKRGEVAK